MSQLRGYSSLFAVGHRLAREVFDGPVVVEEKVDGSQFSFGLDEAGQLHCRSKGAVQDIDAPDSLFAGAVATARRLAPELNVGWTYRGEVLQKPKHNVIVYDRVPAGNVIIFDIDRGDQDYLTPDERLTECGRLGLECVPVLHEGPVESVDFVKALLPERSCLGAVRPEGVVVKNYNHYTTDKKVLMVKLVTEAFKEVHREQWGAPKPAKADIIEALTRGLATVPRWQKAVAHLRDAGTLQEAPQDIGALMKEVNADVMKEETDSIKEALFKWAWPQIAKGITKGLPQWYKDQLAIEAVIGDTSTAFVEAACAE